MSQNTKFDKHDALFIRRASLAITLALTLILALQFISYTIQRDQIAKEHDTAAIISASANQRMLSQRLALLSLALINVQSESIRERTKVEIENGINTMSFLHSALITGDENAGLKAEKSPNIEKIFFDEPDALDRKVGEFLATAKELIRSEVKALSAQNPKLYQLTEMSSDLSHLFQKLTEQYKNESVERIHSLENLTTELLLVQFFVVICSALFIFNPLIKRLKIEFHARAAAQAELLEQNSELEQFAATVAHDLKAPLNNIGGFSQFLRTRLLKNEDPETKEILSLIESGVLRMTKMINELLQYARLTRKQRSQDNIQLNQILEKVKKDFEKQLKDEDAKLTYGALPVVKGDPVQLEHLFLNLISNSLKYRHPERTPQISITCPTVGEHSNGLTKIIIEDNGRGFPEGSEEKMFEPFRRLDPNEAVEGSGFGLAICRKIAKHHKGEITAEHVESGGARFIITLARN